MIIDVNSLVIGIVGEHISVTVEIEPFHVRRTVLETVKVVRSGQERALLVD